MSLLKTIATKALGDGAQSKIDPDRLLEGDPTCTTWEQDAIDGKVETGVWQMTPGKNLMRKSDIYEFCHILEGVVELTEEGKEPVTYRAGDSFVMRPGFAGTWKTIETVRKIYVIID
ncbi:MAG: cupin domain-containing protein [Chelatococcus sp.]|uniref:cupin domain-containing protein n=1 Tax=unclassified Chelatococcus TaxID=2638111 RepID=UPI001BCDCAB0|nr:MULTISPECIES: cupin domain-containing protein [unclassified Chelatococcus]CAH1650369.1 Cupin_3 domain-containing protein [Hyphomicrobiales bacterium]MBS7739724.1 cupin domain-containing protein [Chelatococcus sp. HY11]MBX3540099.1 cupin domain-containing protein [Chelatococcus sp.]MBX3544093.1 cupin domain-containing protein [Chelatococcus sp.]MCO5075740.1 cupin domain-containing protein [Chelatococcus sp.]